MRTTIGDTSHYYPYESRHREHVLQHTRATACYSAQPRAHGTIIVYTCARATGIKAGRGARSVGRLRGGGYRRQRERGRVINTASCDAAATSLSRERRRAAPRPTLRALPAHFQRTACAPPRPLFVGAGSVAVRRTEPNGSRSQTVDEADWPTRGKRKRRAAAGAGGAAGSDGGGLRWRRAGGAQLRGSSSRRLPPRTRRSPS